MATARSRWGEWNLAVAGREPAAYPRCFGCGSDNPRGLALPLSLVEERLTTVFTAGEAHQGWPGAVHGGVISSILYEVMANLPRYLSARAGEAGGDHMVLRSCNVRFRRPVPLGRRLCASASVAGRSDRAWALTADLRDTEGALLATAEGEAVSLGADRASAFGMR